jgi:L-threonylcarbamoyladenylate synthase
VAPQQELIQAAAACLLAGELVVFPTETVYGLGANALDAAAVGRIFALKGRPACNPLIVHVASVEQAITVAAEWPAVAARLAERFWPGPLTLVLPKRPQIPAVVTAGGSTVGIRLPKHPVALALLREAGVPLAAPSANRSTAISPTRVEHVLQSLKDVGELLILDAGPCPGGIESTVLDLTISPPRLLRPGLISVAMLEDVIGPVVVPSHPASAADPILRSPGLMARHYAPRTPLELVAPEQLESERQRRLEQGIRCGVLQLPTNPEQAATMLYDALHHLDAGGYDVLLAPWPPDTVEWLAIRDRLLRACQR